MKNPEPFQISKATHRFFEWSLQPHEGVYFAREDAGREAKLAFEAMGASTWNLLCLVYLSQPVGFTLSSPVSLHWSAFATDPSARLIALLVLVSMLISTSCAARCIVFGRREDVGKWIRSALVGYYAVSTMVPWALLHLMLLDESYLVRVTTAVVLFSIQGIVIHLSLSPPPTDGEIELVQEVMDFEHAGLDFEVVILGAKDVNQSVGHERYLE
ncbi:hypothetical protein T439DRAFT_381830 [Meredithblackwellia eburnea MCA 4105]